MKSIFPNRTCSTAVKQHAKKSEKFSIPTEKWLIASSNSRALPQPGLAFPKHPCAADPQSSSLILSILKRTSMLPTVLPAPLALNHAALLVTPLFCPPLHRFFCQPVFSSASANLLSSRLLLLSLQIRMSSANINNSKKPKIAAA